tara:strand:+ start:9033 stop:10208 length:1176 start_codon:yes stop_codon:yes gene_type:complete
MTAVGPLGNTAMVYRETVAAATAGGDATKNKLWLPIWSGEVIHAYDEYNSFEPLVNSKTISSGREMTFPMTGTVDLKASWDAGEELTGSTNNAASKAFSVFLDDRPMAAHFEIDNIDLMLTQWEFRAELARQAGLTLANTRDKQIYAYLCRASADAQIADDPRGVTFHSGFASSGLTHLGNAASAASLRTTAALSFLQNLEDFVVHLQEQSIPTEGVYACVTPQAFQDIRALGVARDKADVINAQPMFGGVAQAGGLGAPFTRGMNNMQDSLEYMGVTIIKSNHMSTDDKSGGTNPIGGGRYNLDFAAGEIKSIVWQSNAVAAIKLQGLKVDTVDDIRRNTVFTVASMMAGTGVLKPECAAFMTANADHDTRAEMKTALDYGGSYNEYVAT